MFENTVGAKKNVSGCLRHIQRGEGNGGMGGGFGKKKKGMLRKGPSFDFNAISYKPKGSVGGGGGGGENITEKMKNP